MIVIKRDGRKVVFQKEKIVNAILKAFREVDGEITDYANTKAREIARYIESTNQDYDVETIQNAVEEKLMASDRKDVARAYVIYRNDRNRVREKNGDLMKRVKAKLDATDVENQNANVDERSFGGRIGAVNSEIMKQYALNNCMSEMAKNNHLNNEIYIHDLDHYPIGDHNCLTCPIDTLLANGFNTRQTDVRPAGSVNTAFQLVAVIFQLQSLQQFGGVSASHIDWTMVPYVRKSFIKHFKDGLKYVSQIDYGKYDGMYDEDMSIDSSFYKSFGKAYDYAMDMTTKEVHQSAEGMYHNLNTLQSRSGNQLPFSSINYGTCTLIEGRMVTKALLDVSIEGLGKLHKTSIFPCGIFQCMNGVNRKPGDKNYDLFKLALRSTAQRLYPNYANVDWSVNAGFDKNDPKQYVSTMGCRTYNGYDINGLGWLKDGRGNICPVTIILPTLAMESGKDVESFIKLLDTKIDQAKDMLIERYNYICSQSPKSASFMYENKTMDGFDGENIESSMKHGTLVIGQLGLAETLQILIGCDHTTDKGMKLAKRIEQLFKDRCAEYKKKHSLNFGVYYTPKISDWELRK